MKLNGTEIRLEKPQSLKSFLQDNKMPMEKSAVEVNGDIIPRSEFETHMVYDEDTIEVVSFVGGG